MLQQFLAYIKTQALFSSEDKILLAVSGGMDSVLMAHLFAEAGLSFGIAHCNFKLRGIESDGDADFVESLAKDTKVSFHLKNFDTQAYADQEKISIQMAARDLRYEWLESIRKENNYSYIATAHHLNDSIETVIYNFSKGCGIRGLHGISPKKDKIIRPLLFAKRAEIADNIKDNSFQFREDASNASEKYSRNFIRHQIVPKLKELNSSFEKSTQETIQKIRETEFLFQQSVEFYKKEITTIKEDSLFIDYKKLPKEAAHTLLFEILNPMGFHGDQVKMILDQDHQSGVSFFTKSHILLIDRDQYIVKKNEVPKLVTLKIKASEEAVMIKDKMLIFEVLDNVPDPIPRDATIAILDFEKLSFPLQLRPWKDGDIFQPFGMNGQHQKVKDFLTNKKLSRFEKDEVHVIESDGIICWIVGLRIDERFRILENTSKLFRITQKHTLVSR